MTFARTTGTETGGVDAAAFLGVSGAALTTGVGVAKGLADEGFNAAAATGFESPFESEDLEGTASGRAAAEAGAALGSTNVTGMLRSTRRLTV